MFLNIFCAQSSFNYYKNSSGELLSYFIIAQYLEKLMGIIRYGMLSLGCDVFCAPLISSLLELVKLRVDRLPGFIEEES
jgi:hypothetical protein